MNNPDKYSGKRLKMSMARELIIELFKGQTVPKQDIISRVDKIHLERGGKPSENIIHPVTDALNTMKRKELANNPNPGDGIWTIIGETAAEEDEEIDDSDNSTDEVRRIGSGSSSVYVYYYPAYKERAELREEETWPCKIGRSEYANPIHRIREQAGTGMPEKPEIALIIQTNVPEDVEDAIHRLLARVPDAPGTEWVLTNPSKVEEIFNIINKSYS